MNLCVSSIVYVFILCIVYICGWPDWFTFFKETSDVKFTMNQNKRMWNVNVTYLLLINVTTYCLLLHWIFKITNA